MSSQGDSPHKMNNPLPEQGIRMGGSRTVIRLNTQRVANEREARQNDSARENDKEPLTVVPIYPKDDDEEYWATLASQLAHINEVIFDDSVPDTDYKEKWNKLYPSEKNFLLSLLKADEEMEKEENTVTRDVSEPLPLPSHPNVVEDVPKNKALPESLKEQHSSITINRQGRVSLEAKRPPGSKIYLDTAKPYHYRRPMVVNDTTHQEQRLSTETKAGRRKRRR